MTEEGGVYMSKLLIGLSVVVAGAMLLRAVGRISNPAYTQVLRLQQLNDYCALVLLVLGNDLTWTLDNGHLSLVCCCAGECAEELYSSNKVRPCPWTNTNLETVKALSSITGHKTYP